MEQPETHWPRISIVIVNKNLGRWLDAALNSVVSQHYPELELIVIDGGSTDESLDVIRKYESAITRWVSEADSGQYDAVQKGFAMSTGEIMAWLNSDDIYLPGALHSVAEIFQNFPDVRWIQGFPGEMNEADAILQRITLPWSRWSRRRYLTGDYQFIQQESVFWKRSLWKEAGARMETQYRLAGDLALWTRFFRFEKLCTVQVCLAAFRHRKSGQRSKAELDTYLSEAASCIQNEIAGLPLLHRAGYALLRWVAFVPGLFYFSDIPVLRSIYSNLMRLPRVIRYDVQDNRWVMGSEQIKHPPLMLMGRRILNPFRKR